MATSTDRNRRHATRARRRAPSQRRPWWRRIPAPAPRRACPCGHDRAATARIRRAPPGPTPARRTCRAAGRAPSGRSASRMHERDVAARGRLRHQANRNSPTPCNTRPISCGSVCSASPTTQTIAMSCSVSTSANCDSASMIGGSRRRSSIVTDTRHLGRGHDVDGGLPRLEDLEQPPQEAVRHQHPRRRDADDADAFFDAMAVSGRADSGRSPVISVPRACGRCEFRMRTGILRETAG